MTDRRVRHNYQGREYPLELRLLQFFMFAEFGWAALNALLSFVQKLPIETCIMYLVLTVSLPVCICLVSFPKHNQVFIKLYFYLYLLVNPFVWKFAGGNPGSANILFICELICFAMCLNGKRQKVFMILSLISSSAMAVLERKVPLFAPIHMDDYQLSMASRNMGLLTSIIVILLLLKQKNEYAKERDIAIKSEKELEKSNQMQKNFLANMSHEIRSPLGIVLGFNHLVRESDDINQIHEYSENIEKAGDTLHIVINDILDYSKIESGKLDIINVDYSFGELIGDVGKDMGLKCAEKGLKFVVENDDSIPAMLFGDNIRIKQCLLNLLSNAVKYTDQGAVTLRTKREAAQREGYCTIRFDVIDTGHGIEKDMIPQLFGAFQRLDEGQNRGIEGTGLGLAITKNLIDEMNGRIEVESEVKVGSTFTIILEQKISTQVKNVVTASDDEIDISGLKVLAVDDTKANLILIQKLLAKKGIQTDTADSGLQCLKMCADKAYDVILLDHMMPEMDGVEVFGRLRGEGGANKETPVVMLTANAMAGASTEYTDLGFDAYVSKPIVVNDLMKAIYTTTAAHKE